MFAIPYSSLNGLDIDNGEKPIIESIDLFSENPIFSRFEYELPPLEKYQCLFHILGNLSYAYRLATIWDAIKNDLNNHMDAWKKCPDASNHIDYEKYVHIATMIQFKKIWIGFSNHPFFQTQSCVLKEGFAVVLLHRNYLVTLKSHEKGPEIIKEYEKLSKEKCFGNKMIEYECQFEALAKVSEDNGLSKEWANIKYDVEHHIEAFKKCRELYPKSERLYKRY